MITIMTRVIMVTKIIVTTVMPYIFFIKDYGNNDKIQNITKTKERIIMKVIHMIISIITRIIIVIMIGITTLIIIILMIALITITHSINNDDNDDNYTNIDTDNDDCVNYNNGNMNDN